MRHLDLSKNRSYATEKNAKQKLEKFAAMIGDATTLIATQVQEDGTIRFVPVVIHREGQSVPFALAHNGITIIN
jgi:hypothetical protein